MKIKLLITSAAAALVAGTVLAAGQGMPKQQPGGADRGATQERTEGQGQRGEPDGKAQQGQPEQGRKGREQSRQGQREQGRQGERDEQPQGGKQKAQRDEGPRGAKAQGQRDEAPKNGKAQQGERDEGQKGKQQGQREDGRRGSQQGQAEGRQKAGGSTVTLSAEQRTQIRETVIRSGSAKVTRVTFPVRVGTVIPRTVRVVEVPELIIEIHPEWRSFRYFVYEDEIVIVDPNTLRIVAVIAV